MRTGVGVVFADRNAGAESTGSALAARSVNASSESATANRHARTGRMTGSQPWAMWTPG